MLKTFTLKNGLKVAQYSMPTIRSAFLTLAVKGGAIFDPDKKDGTGHFMEHLLVQGTPSFPTVESLSDYIEKLAGGYNASTSFQSIRFTINAPADHISDMIRISSEVFFSPLFADESIKRERTAIISEIRQRRDTLSYKNGDFFDEIRYKKGHLALRDIAGTVESVRKIKRDDLVAFWKELFFPSNTYLVVVGGFNAMEIESLTDKYFGEYTSQKQFSGFPNLTNNDLSDKMVAIREDKKLQSAYITISFPSVSDQVPLKDRVVQGTISNILGGLRSSRLYRLLRQQRGLVYHVSVGVSSYETFGFTYISSQVPKESVDEVLELIFKELSGFIKNGPTDEEVAFAKNYSINRNLMQFDHPSAIASWIEDDLMWEDQIYLPEEYVKIVQSVTREDIVDSIRKYWDLSKINLVIQGPIANSVKNKEKYSQMMDRI